MSEPTNEPTNDPPAAPWTKPRPLLDPVSTAYWQAAREGRLLVQECPACGHRQWYPRALCTVCAAEPSWIGCTGRGTVHTFTVIRQNGTPGFVDELPYVVAMIDLDEGVRVMGNVLDAAVEDVHIGMAVEVVFVPVDDEIAVPQWRPAGA
jgi:uncharacterized OB-fold protein